MYPRERPVFLKKIKRKKADLCQILLCHAKASKRKKERGQDVTLASVRKLKKPNKPAIIAQFSATKIPCTKYGQDFFST